MTRRVFVTTILLLTMAALTFQAPPGAAQGPDTEKPPDTMPDAPPSDERPIGASSTYGQQSFFDSIGGPIAIPDGAGAPITNSIVVTDSFPIVDLNLALDIPHTWVGDLVVTLTHDDTGTSATVIDRPGTTGLGFGCSQDNIDATLDDEAATAAESTCVVGTPTISGTVRPNNPLSIFDGESTAGTWTLLIDDVEVPDVGTLDNWSFTARGTTLPLGSVPLLAIPDNNIPGVNDSFYTKNGHVITDLNVNLLIPHTWVGDLVVTLTHVETGTSVTIMDRPGYAGAGFGCSGDNINAILDDEAGSPVESQCALAVPTIGGSFTPNNLLSAFDGQLIGGTWTLNASDRAGGDLGQLTFWSLSITAEGCASGVNNSFEAGATNTSIIPCWTVVNQPGSAGSWCTQSGAVPPACGGAPGAVPAPPQGVQSVMANEGNQTTTVMYRCGIPTAGGVRFSVFLRNYYVNWVPETTLDFMALGGNQQFRADIVSRDGILDDPFTTSPQHILMNLYQTQPPDPLDTVFYVAVTDDISAFIGDSVCLRFATVASEAFLVVGIDDVIFQAKDLKDDPDSDIIQNDVDPDDDNDRCSDAREFNDAVGSQFSGGLRNPHNFWDFYDVPTGGGLVRDGSVSALDIFAVLGRFATVGNPAIDPLSVPPPNGYHTAYDRGVVLGPNVWNLGPANGSIASTDLFGVLGQFTHSCV